MHRIPKYSASPVRSVIFRIAWAANGRTLHRSWATQPNSNV